MTSEVKRVPELRFPEFSGEWEEDKLRDLLEDNVILEQSDGNHGELYPKSSEFTEDGIPYLAASNISNNSISYQNIKYLPLERAKQFKKGVARDGDILLAHNATVGPSTLLITDFPFVILSTTLTLYRINKVKMDNHFFLNEIRSNNVQNQLKKLMKQTTRNQVPILLQRTMHISYPKILAEQQKIGEFFSKLDRQIELEEQKLAKLEEQKKGYMQKIFSQELRFKDNNGEEYPKWESKKLEEVAIINTGKSKIVNEENAAYSNLGSTGVLGKSSHYEYDGNFILTARVGHYAGKLYNFSGKANISDNTIFLETDLNLNFTLNMLNNYNLKRIAFGSGQPLIKSSELKKLIFNIPCGEEEQKIGGFLSGFDSLIGKQSHKIELLKECKKGFLQKMFV
ncbi:restriction endonuclease subunit S [Staphylococcus nepalensis]|nr:restriction endonuclease subunit S [Staphylococcus nepalensis]